MVLARNIGSNQVSLAMDMAYELMDKHKLDALSGVADSGCAYTMAKLATQYQMPLAIMSNAGMRSISCEWVPAASFGQSTPKIVLD